MKLEKYNVLQVDQTVGIPLDHLEDVEVLLPIIDKYTDYLQTNSRAIAASLFLKRYAVLTAAACVDYFDLQRQKYDWLQYATFDLESFTLQVPRTIQFCELHCWKTHVIGKHLKTLIEILSKTCKINERILWENIAVRINACIRRNVDAYDAVHVERVIKEICDPNPNWYEQQCPVSNYIHLYESKRATCCRYYQLNKKEEGMPYCLVCPLKKEGQ